MSVVRSCINLLLPVDSRLEIEKCPVISCRCYGAANIIKLLSGLSKDLRGDALQSLAYEAQAR